MPRTLTALLAAASLLSCTSPARRPDQPVEAPPKTEGTIRLTLIGTNDLHGWVQPHETKLSDGTVVKEGGIATFAAYVEKLRAENPKGTVLVDAGDMFQGTLASNLSEGEVVIAAYNALHYDAAAVGNHEFDYGPVGPRSAAIDPTDNPFGALTARAKQAKFPLLGRNIYDAKTGERPTWLGNDGTTIIEREGVKIGIVGMTTPSTPHVTNPVNVMTLTFHPLAQDAAEAAKALRAKGADLVVAVIHAGGKCRSLSDPNRLDTCESHSEAFDLLDALPEGTLDAVVAGHTHAQVGHFVHGTPVIESGSYGRQFGTITLEVDAATHKVVKDATKIRAGMPVCEQVFAGTGDCEPKGKTPPVTLVPVQFGGGPITPSAELNGVIAPYLAKVEQEQQRPLNVMVPATLFRDSKKASGLGSALADAVRAMEGADVALLNSGGLRSDLPQGPLTYGGLYEVFPFDNTIATLQVTGKELTALLDALLSGEHGVPQTSGLKFHALVCNGKGHIDSIALADGRKLEPGKLYKLTTSDFLALGGDGTGPVLEGIDASRKDLGHKRDLNMRDALAAYLSKRGGTLEAPKDDRMQLAQDPSCGK